VQIDVTEQKQAEEALRSSEEFFRALYEDVHHPIFLLDGDLNFVDVNPYACEFYGYSHEEFKGMKVQDITLPEEREGQPKYAEQIREQGSIFIVERRHRKKNGEVVTVTVDAAKVTRSGQKLYVSKITDITERKEAEEKLRQSEERFRLLVEGVKDYAIFMLDPNGQIASWNEGAQHIKGYRAEEIIGEHFSTFYTEEDIERGHPEEELRVAVEEGRYEEEGLRVRKDGSRFWANVLITALRDENGNLHGFSKVTRDVTERRALEELLEYQAFHDPLTDLPNRTLLMDCLEQALARGQRKGGEVAILLVDLDDLKVINDSLGHECGDRLLVSVGRRLKALVRPGDTIARFGGDEFVVVLEDTDAEEAGRVAQRLVEGMRTFFALDGRELTITCSVGIALGGSDGERAACLLRKADMALYEAKAKGKNRHALFEEEMETRAMERLETEHTLRQTIEQEDGLVVHYQPVISFEEGGRIVGFEALVRWNHPLRGLLPPGEFLALAEQTGMIVGIGHWVLTEACHQAKEWQERYPSEQPLAVSVNLSASQLSYPSLVEDIAHTVKRFELEPRNLILEVTESAMMEDMEASAAVLRQLKDLGVRIAVDDFGNGHSSLSYLKRLPVDILKIDCSFVAGLGTDSKDEGIVRAVIDLAHTLDLEVIAEGVESGEQLAHLREVGCELAQGFYFWKPLPAERADELLATYNYP
jgi:diguanylate cyclase (GGDEF)-like protein/PAS domain S-box-containing protein